MHDLQKHSQNDDPVFFEFEQIAQQYVSYIYQNVIELLQNASLYSSYDELTALICANNGSLESTSQALREEKSTLKNILNLKNIEWLMEIKQENSCALD
jgi:hypothetical protein